MERMRIAFLQCKFQSALRLMQLSLKVGVDKCRGFSGGFRLALNEAQWTAALAVAVLQQMQASAVVFQNRKPA